MFPAYLSIPACELGSGQPVRLRVLGDATSLARDMAGAMFDEIAAAARAGRAGTFIVPVGPVDQYAILARRINEEGLCCREVMFINMDEYLTDNDRWIEASHPLSFRGFMDREFYGRLEPDLSPRKEFRIFPDPSRPEAIGAVIQERGGVDACFGGIGINGHIAFNEPPERGEPCAPEAFAASTTRVLTLSRETRTINSVTVGGEIGIVPWRAVTVGMKEILGARRLRFYANRPWQSAVVRRGLHGPITPQCPVSFLRRHTEAWLTMADYVAAPPCIRLR